jgi:hypothetical protein
MLVKITPRGVREKERGKGEVLNVTQLKRLTLRSHLGLQHR